MTRLTDLTAFPAARIARARRYPARYLSSVTGNARSVAKPIANPSLETRPAGERLYRCEVGFQFQ